MIFDRWELFEVSASQSSPLLSAWERGESCSALDLTTFLKKIIFFLCVCLLIIVQMYQCPYCKFSNTDLNRLRMHVMTQHSVQPMFRCPLCQDMLNNKVHLQFHLTHLHSVAPDCVDKLIATVSCCWMYLPLQILPSTSYAYIPIMNVQDIQPSFPPRSKEPY